MKLQAPPGDSSVEDLPLQRLEDEIVALAAEVYALTCRWLCLVAEFERREAHLEWGFHTCSQWLAWRCGLSERAARDHVKVARRLPELPKTRASFARGELSYSKVRALARVATSTDEVELAENATTAQLERIVRAYRGALNIGAAERARSQRHFAWSWEDDGSVSFRGRLPAEEASLFMRALESARDDLHDQSRDIEVTNADAVLSIAETQLAAGSAARSSGERYQVVVHVDADVLAGTSDSGRCATEDGSPLAAETARRLACDASVVPMFERGGEPLSVGRKTRTIPPALARALRARDGGCRFPGCNNRRFVENHHIRPWATGGETSLENSVQLCTRHHHLHHEGGFSVICDGPELVFRRPDGRLIARSPLVARRRGDHGRSRPRRDRRPALGGHGDRLDLAHTIFALLTAPGPVRRCRGPD